MYIYICMYIYMYVYNIYTFICIYIYMLYICLYGIHHGRIFRRSYRKLAWEGFETTTTKFRSDALTD